MDAQNTLHDQLAQALESVETQETAPQIDTQESAKVEAARDEKGRFAAKEVAAGKPVEKLQEAAPEISAEPEKPKSNRPSTWKKDYWEKFDSLDPELQSYINQRENEYKSGVSTYRQEAERAKQLWSAVEPFMPALQQHNIDPGTWIRNLGNAHQMLATGSPQQKVQLFQQLAREYGVPLEGMGQLAQQQAQGDPNVQWLTQQVQSLQSGWNSFQQQQRQAEQQGLFNQINEFATNAPHFEQVRETMAGLLQAGLAQDLKGAYEKAIRMHDDIWQQEQEKARAAQEAERQRHAVEVAKQARAVAVSPKSGTPASTAKAGSGQGLRETLMSQLDGLGARA